MKKLEYNPFKTRYSSKDSIEDKQDEEVDSVDIKEDSHEQEFRGLPNDAFNVAENVKGQAQNAAHKASQPINTLPKDMVEYISTFLTEPNDKQVYALALGTHSPKFFNWVLPMSTEVLLVHVMSGDLDAVETMLKANRYLLYKKATITDLSGRTFKKITAFQYAVWALDTPMWELILQYLPEEQAAMQLKDFESRKDIIDEHGAHFSFDPILKNLKHYIGHCDGWGADQCKEYWCKEVGGAQRAFPAWLIMTMCEEGREVAWVKQDPTLTVKRDTKQLKWWMGKEYHGGVLGSKWAAARVGNSAAPTCRGSGWGRLAVTRSSVIMSAKISLAQSQAVAKLKVQLYPNDDLSSEQCAPPRV